MTYADDEHRRYQAEWVRKKRAAKRAGAPMTMRELLNRATKERQARALAKAFGKPPRAK